MNRLMVLLAVGLGLAAYHAVGGAGAANEDRGDRLRPFDGNRFYWQFHGVVLI